MKLTLRWLKDHLDTEASLEALGEKLTVIGLEIESIEDRAKALEPFTVGYVIEASQHPNADRLRVCRVDTGKGEVQVVCGAPNARTGMKGVFAPAGTRIPGTGVDLKETSIRGVDSRGMLCSEREMGLSQEHDGIIELPDDAPVGASFAQVMGLDDPVIDVAITPNRGDCLGVYGIARDLAAAGMGRLKPFKADAVKGTFTSPIQWKRNLPDDKGDACPFVAGRLFRNVKNGPSPKWLQDRLRAIGLRPISALVDITNFVTFDLGRPLHVFDADKLKGDPTMRMARAGETILALNGKTYELDAEAVVIADDARVLAIGGIMGGEETGCTEATTSVFLEAALFDPIRIAATGRRLSIESDARYRFERGVDPASALWGVEVGARLIRELCGGEVSEVTVAGAVPKTERPISLRADRVMTLVGADVPVQEQTRILDALGFAPRAMDGVIRASVPSWRRDVDGEADLVEEVARIWGYDRIPMVPLRIEDGLPSVALTSASAKARLARRALAARGMVEAVTWSFMPAAPAVLFGGGKDALKLANPISADLDEMRPSILPNLIAAAARNADRGMGDLALFEVGPQYAGDQPSDQALVAAGVLAGRTGPRHWAANPRAVDAFDAKAASLSVLRACRAPLDKLQVTTDAPGWYHPGKSGTLRLGPVVLAHFGELHPKVLKPSDLRGAVAAFEIYLNAVPEPRAKKGKARPLLKASPFQPVERDFAFVLPADVPADKLLTSVRQADKALIADVQVFDVYTGDKVGAGKKSVAVSVTLQPTERTLTDAEIEAIGKKIIQNVEKQTGGVLRT
ncbi:MAG: phenylalanine--tRNA ligase subunit beta [Alphaproteobacteria bacterium]